jgi:hypothetical protein
MMIKVPAVLIAIKRYHRLGKYLTNFRYPARTNLVIKKNGTSDLLKGCGTQRDNEIFE